jgi:S-adenosylmethionine:tRNA ribosyltransferase-isomerase
MDERLSPYHYVLPPEQIARHPPESREGGRLLMVEGGDLVEGRIEDLSGRVSEGDLLVVNDTRVLHARLAARRETGGKVELLLMPDPDAEERYLAMARPARRLRQGERLAIISDSDESGRRGEGAWAELGARREDGTFEIDLHPDADQVMASAGEIPIPPYLDRDALPSDLERYQTVYSGTPGAVAAPTAGLHLTRSLLDDVRERGCAVAKITLHVGAGTFRNLRGEDLDRGRLHRERFVIPQSTSDAIERTRQRGGRVIAVGTTSTRALESAALPGGRVRAGAGLTDLFIRPGYHFAVVDRLWTNFHLPCSSLLMLVCAFGGVERVMAAYAHAVAAEYRFYSYGDAMWITPGEDGSVLGG